MAIFGRAFPLKGVWRSKSLVGAAAISGAANQTIADVTPSATGALLIQGAAAQTIDAVTQTATGAALISGQSAQTIADVTGAAVSDIDLAAQVGGTLDAVTQSASGALALVGLASQSLGDVTSGGVGIVQLDPSGGGYIVGGTFSRGKWRDIKAEELRRKLAALDAEKRRKQKIIDDAIAAKAAARAEVEAQRAEAARLAEEAALQRLLSGAQSVATGTQGLQGEFASAQNIERMIAEAVARQMAEQEDEDEAITLLLLAS